MGVCEFCDLSANDKKWLLFKNDFWNVYLANKQDYIGRCIIVSKRHCESLSELTSNEWFTLKDIISFIENILKSELGAAMFNWSCLMNDAYKSNPPHPHVHFHVRPRYDAPICIEGNLFTDEEFAHHYNNRRENRLDEAAKEHLYLKLKQKICMYFDKI